MNGWRKGRGVAAASALALAWLTAVPATAYQCPQPPDTRVHVNVKNEYAKVNYRFDHDRTALNKLATGMATTHKGSVLGLTVSRYGLKTQTQQQLVKADNGLTCLWIRRVDATLYIPDTTIYIASNYKQGSCQYNAVLEHEQEHVRLTRNLLPGFSSRLEQELKAQLGRINPVVTRAPDNASRIVQREIEKSMGAFMQRLENERDRANAHIDTEASYNRTAARCPRW